MKREGEEKDGGEGRGKKKREKREEKEVRGGGGKEKKEGDDGIHTARVWGVSILYCIYITISRAWDWCKIQINTGSYTLQNTSKADAVDDLHCPPHHPSQCSIQIRYPSREIPVMGNKVSLYVLLLELDHPLITLASEKLG